MPGKFWNNKSFKNGTSSEGGGPFFTGGIWTDIGLSVRLIAVAGYGTFKSFCNPI